MASTWTKSPAEIIKDLIAASNAGFDAVRADFDLGAVSVTALNSRNATLTVSPNDTDTYNGTVAIFYNRLTVADYATAKGGDTVTWTGTAFTAATSAADQLAAVNQYFGTALAAGDVTLTFDEVTAGTQYTIEVAATATNLLFTGTVTLTFNQTAPKTETSSIVTDPILDGLDAPTA